MEALLDEGYTVSLETNGSFLVDKVPPAVIKVIDLKCPTSGEVEANEWGNCSLVRPHDQIKFVVGSKADFDWAQAKSAEHGLHEKCSVLYSPVAGKVKPLELAEWILEAGADVTMQVQLHKEIWGPDKRGV
jgi:7-carboxy-7-deazaguanine synthase